MGCLIYIATTLPITCLAATAQALFFSSEMLFTYSSTIAVLNTVHKGSLTSSHVTGNTVNLQTVIVPQSPDTLNVAYVTENKEERAHTCYTFFTLSVNLMGDSICPVIHKLLVTQLKKYIATFSSDNSNHFKANKLLDIDLISEVADEAVNQFYLLFVNEKYYTKHTLCTDFVISCIIFPPNHYF